MTLLMLEQKKVPQPVNTRTETSLAVHKSMPVAPHPILMPSHSVLSQSLIDIPVFLAGATPHHPLKPKPINHLHELTPRNVELRNQPKHMKLEHKKIGEN